MRSEREGAKLFAIGVATRVYRGVKTYLIRKQPPLLTPLFFGTLPLVDKLLSPRSKPAEENLAEWKAQYERDWQGDRDRQLTVETETPVAVTSHDHIHPRGALFDNSVNPAFNRRLYEFLGHPRRIRFLDLGCSGGGLVRSFIADGHIAVGIEGSDVSRRLQSGEWGTIPHSLFTADITKPFTVRDADGGTVHFDVVTAWEVLEHIPAAVLDGLLSNIARHVRDGGYFIGSVDMLPDGDPVKGIVYHNTLEPREWWEARFRAHGLVPVAEHPFRRHDMVRGNGLSLKDWRPEHGTGFHLVLQKQRNGA